MNNLKLAIYPEQERSIKKIQLKAILSIGDYRTWGDLTHSNAERLQYVIDENMDFILNCLVSKQYTDAVTFFAEYEYLHNALTNYYCVWLLAKNTLTNRIIKACNEKQMSDAIVYRIRECITAYSIISATGFAF